MVAIGPRGVGRVGLPLDSPYAVFPASFGISRRPLHHGAVVVLPVRAVVCPEVVTFSSMRVLFTFHRVHGRVVRRLSKKVLVRAFVPVPPNRLCGSILPQCHVVWTAHHFGCVMKRALQDPLLPYYAPFNLPSFLVLLSSLVPLVSPALSTFFFPSLFSHLVHLFSFLYRYPPFLPFFSGCVGETVVGGCGV